MEFPPGVPPFIPGSRPSDPEGHASSANTVPMKLSPLPSAESPPPADLRNKIAGMAAEGTTLKAILEGMPSNPPEAAAKGGLSANSGNVSFLKQF